MSVVSLRFSLHWARRQHCPVTTLPSDTEPAAGPAVRGKWMECPGMFCLHTPRSLKRPWVHIQFWHEGSDHITWGLLSLIWSSMTMAPSLLIYEAREWRNVHQRHLEVSPERRYKKHLPGKGLPRPGWSECILAEVSFRFFFFFNSEE